MDFIGIRLHDQCHLTVNVALIYVNRTYVP